MEEAVERPGMANSESLASHSNAMSGGVSIIINVDITSHFNIIRFKLTGQQCLAFVF